MKEFQKYDPEDIESLLLHKAFDELYESEKIFVLRHINSAEEYESMRVQLLQIRQLIKEKNNNGFFEPDPGSRQKLLAYMEESKPKRVLWLNSFLGFFNGEGSFRTPAFRIAVIILAAISGIVLYMSLPENKLKEPVLADKKEAVISDSFVNESTAPPDTFRIVQATPPIIEKKEAEKPVAEIISTEKKKEQVIVEYRSATSAEVMEDSKIPVQAADSVDLLKHSDKTIVLENNAAGTYNYNYNNDLNRSSQFSIPSNSNVPRSSSNSELANSRKAYTVKATAPKKLSRSMAETAILQQLLVEAF